MKLADFQALSFDCYGTLIDWEAGLSAVLAPWAAARGLDLSAEQLLAEYAGFEAEIETQQPSALYPESWRAACAAWATSWAPRSPATTRPGWPTRCRTGPRSMTPPARWPTWPGASSSSSCPTWTGPRSPDRTRRLGVTFASVLTAQDIGSYKPAPRNFDALLAQAARLGIEPGRLLHVAQSLFHDHVPAKAAGLPTVWINRRHARPGWGATPEPAAPVTPDWEFESLAAFAAAVDAG